MNNEEKYLADPADLALRTGMPETDPRLLLELRRVSDRFREETGRVITPPVTEIVYLSGRGHTALRLPGAPVTGPITVLINGEEVTDYEVGRASALLRRTGGKVWPDGLENIEVMYTHGWEREDVPRGISDAVLELAEIGLNTTAGIEEVATGNERVRTSRILSSGGSTPAWGNAVAKYGLHRGVGERA